MPIPANLHLEIQSHRANHYGILRSSFRANGKVQHTNHGRISGLPLDKLKLIQAAFRGDVVAKNSADAFQVLSSREYGASHAFVQLAKDLGLPEILYSRNEPWVAPALAMIVGRIVYAGSKLALSQQGPNTVLWELCGVEGKVDVDKHCYEVMDRLLERQAAIQRALARKHLQNGHLVLYDITSSYLEGEYEGSQLVDFGYNRDGKRGHEQIVIALLCNEQGCPVGVEVWAGNTKDDKTVPAKVEQIQKEYGISQLIFVGDRGMITQASSQQIKGVQGLQTISALTHRQTVELLERKVIRRELFDEKSIAEVIDPDDPTAALLFVPQSRNRAAGNADAPSAPGSHAPATGKNGFLQKESQGREDWSTEWAGSCSVSKWASLWTGRSRKANCGGVSRRRRLPPKSALTAAM